MKGPVLFQGEIIVRQRKYIDKIKKSSSPELLGQFQPNLAQSILLSRTIKPISTKLGTKQPWVKGIQFCPNEGPRHFVRGDNYKIVKIHLRNLKIFFSRTAGPISTNLGTKHPWVKGIQVCSNEGPSLFQDEIIQKQQKYIDEIKKFLLQNH